MTVRDVAEIILEKVTALGQSYLNVMGDMSKKVSRLAVGTGAITRLPAMKELGADILLATDDGLHTTYNGLYSVDQDIPVVVVHHPTRMTRALRNMSVENLVPPHVYRRMVTLRRALHRQHLSDSQAVEGV